MKKPRTDLTVEAIADGVWRINEYDFANAYLVEGTEKACLIDCGNGCGDISAVVKRLTGKPLLVLVTHAHSDHDGGSVWFPEIYIHPADMKVSRMDRMAWMRMYFLTQHKYKRVSHKVTFASCLQHPYNPVMHPVDEGTVFDLGGRVIETYFTPGHTVGHVTFRDSATGFLFAGDNVNPLVTLQYANGCSVEEWVSAAEKTLSLGEEGQFWGGHGDGRLHRADMEASLAMAREILERQDTPKKGTGKKRGDSKLPCILYRTDRIHKK